MRQHGNRIGIVAGVVGIAALLLSGCAGAGPGTGDEGAADAPTTATSDAPTTEETQAAAEIDCVAVGDTLIAWVDASFAAISTEVTNAEVAAKYVAAADAFDATTAPGADQWEDLGAVIDEYVSQWSALPADAGAIENAETVEAHVDAFAAGIGFDNDEFDDMTPIVGEACAAELEGLFES
jgi:hypothetical protein